MSDAINTLAPILHAVRQRTAQKETALIAIDGRCGSGKTTLAAWLHASFDCTVLHMDDFYLPLSDRLSNWAEQPAGNMDLTRFRTETLLPARAGHPIPYRAFSCRTGTYAPLKTLPPRPLIIVEGSYCLHPTLAPLYDLRIFLTCSKEVQLDRLHAREGAHITAFSSMWIPMEERYFQCCGLPTAADLILDTTHLSFPHLCTEKE